MVKSKSFHANTNKKYLLVPILKSGEFLCPQQAAAAAATTKLSNIFELRPWMMIIERAPWRNSV
jgi:hypothetical protein